jgi:hypothetical protein
MANRDYLTQIRVDSQANKDKDAEGKVTKISEPEFTALLRQYWSATPDPQLYPESNWQYLLRKSPNDMGHGELNLLGNDTVSARHLSVIRWILLVLLVQRYLKRPLYMWNDSDLDHFLEITDTTTERDILLFLDGR